MKTPILIVEDESIVAMEIAGYVEQLDFDVAATATNAKDAYALALQHRPHIILMDVNLKGEEDGIDAAQKILQQMHAAIIYITAFNDDATIERAVATAPAAYLIKPFHRKELVAALKIALMQHNKNRCDLHVIRGDIIFDGEFSYDSAEKQLICCCEYVHLTQRENELLQLLLSSKNAIVSFYEIENSIWPNKPPIESTRRALVSRLRSKLKHQFIETIPAIGYRIKF
jgi:DNA-binding response OmpR family regulator